MIYCKELDKEFKDEKTLIKSLFDNKKEIIDFKKSEIHIGNSLIGKSKAINKSLTTNNDDTDSVLKRTIIGNTYFWLDQHLDVHLKNTFGKSLKERENNIRFYHDHIRQVNAKIGNFKKVYQKKVKWKDLNVDKDGYTICLLADAEIIKEYNLSVFTQYKNKEINQHSVGMIYVKLSLAINNPEYKEEYAEWHKHIKKIGNSEKAQKKGYFWAIYEAKLIEISAVTDGSNELTYTYENTKADEKSLSSKQKPSIDTLKQFLLNQ